MMKVDPTSVRWLTRSGKKNLYFCFKDTNPKNNFDNHRLNRDKVPNTAVLLKERIKTWCPVIRFPSEGF